MSQRTKQPSTASHETPANPGSAKSLWSFPVTVAEIPETGREVHFVADQRTRDAVARLAGVVELPRLEASLELTRQGQAGLRAVGRVVATVVQNCVVTLDPIESEIDEAIDLTFTGEPEAGGTRPKAAGHQALDAEDPPEALQDGAVDLAAVAIEFLLLGIDPYPRKEGVTFEAPLASDPSGHPFAALAALKKDGDSRDR